MAGMIREAARLPDLLAMRRAAFEEQLKQRRSPILRRA
jgi:hypothetical protein